MSNRFAIDKTLTVNELRFHYRNWGGRGWPVLLLHGVSSTSHVWDLVAPLLVDEARVIALDLRGHGQSDKPDSDYDFGTVAGDVFGCLRELDMVRPVIVGHGWGASIGLWMAAREPDAVGGLVMVDGGVTDFEGVGWEETVERMMPAALGGMDLEAYRARLMERAPHRLITPAAEAAMLASFEVDVHNRLHRRLPREYHLRILRAMWETRLLPLYEDVTCPVLILACRRWGDAERDESLKRKQVGVRHAARVLADGEVRWLENTAHDAPLQRPRRVSEEILRFLRERI